MRHSSPEEFEQSLVADLRAAATRYPADRELADMIRALRGSSCAFADWWDRSTTLAHHRNEHKVIDHPEVGELELDCDVLSVHGADLRVIVFTAAPDSHAADKLRLLAVLGTENVAASRSTDSL